MVTTPKPLAPVRHPDDDLTIFYPETDGMPLPDGCYQDPLYRTIVSTVEAYLTQLHTNVAVSVNTFIYYEMNNPRRSVSPDCYVSFGVDVDAIIEQNSYLVWRVGKPPDFVLDIASQSTARYDEAGKRDLYARIGMGEHWRYDQTGGQFYSRPLVGERLVNGEYRELPLHQEPDGMIWGHSPALGLDLCWGDGRLRFYDPNAGVWLRDFGEERERAATAVAQVEEERNRADTAVAQVEEERNRADAAEDRIRQLEGRLRQAGIDPSV